MIVREASARKAEETSAVRRKEVKARLTMSILSLGTSAVLPGSEPERKTVDSLVRQMESMNPVREPLGDLNSIRTKVTWTFEEGKRKRPVYDWEDSQGFDARATYDTDSDFEDTVTTASGPRSELLGEWALIYASNGTVVTRTTPAQLLSAFSTLPIGVGIESITQFLQVGPLHACSRRPSLSVCLFV